MEAANALHTGNELIEKPENVSNPQSSYPPSSHGSSTSEVKMSKEIGKAVGYRVLDLQTGALHFAMADAPEPPTAIGLDIEYLSEIWDDSWPSWRSHSPLKIKGQPIPLKCFHMVYRHTAQWKTLKQQWLKWSVS